MRPVLRILTWAGVVIVSAALGVAEGFYRYRDDAKSMTDFLPQVPRMQMDDLTYAFAGPELARRRILSEPPEPPEFESVQDRVDLFRKLRLAVLSETPEEREALLTEVHRTCDCKLQRLRRMVALYAQARLVPPGNDIACPDCKVKRQPLPDLPQPMTAEPEDSE